MKTLGRLAKTLLAGSLSAVLVMGAMTLSAPRADANAVLIHPLLLCGPTILWKCSGIGGPDVLFAGTICKKTRFEHKTGLTCVPLRN